MDFWDDVYKKVSNAANYTAKETGRLSELAKVKYNLMKEKAKLEDAYKEMGELYYNQMKNSEYDDKKIALAYEKIAYEENPTLVSNGTAKKIAEVINESKH